MKNWGKQARYWEQIARLWPVKGYSNSLLAEHKKRVYLGLIDRWVSIADHQTILKTDLFAEAFGLEQFLFEIKPAKNVIGIDISAEIVKLAKGQAGHHSADGSRYLCCDIRRLPLKDSSVDIIISDSSLDHFSSEDDIITALSELANVLRTGGIMFLTIDNRSNLTYPPYFLFRLWMKLGLTPYFVGKTLSVKKLTQTLENIGFDIEESTAVFHYPHPDIFVRLAERLCRWLGRGRLDNYIRKVLAALDSLEKKKTRYLTGRYLALKAVKRKDSAPSRTGAGGR
jgi:SAM-dependent methyltransferase